MPNLKPLFFDSTGSALMRPIGNRAEVLFHYVPNHSDFNMLVCPQSISKTAKCLCCGHSEADVHKNIILCWDRKKHRWAVYIGTVLLFSNIAIKMKQIGITPQMIEDGKSPDIALQRIGNKVEFEVMMWSMGLKVPEVKPNFEVVLKKMAEKSHWATHSKV